VADVGHGPPTQGKKKKKKKIKGDPLKFLTLGSFKDVKDIKDLYFLN
jgi:hypothetical protein